MLSCLPTLPLIHFAPFCSVAFEDVACSVPRIQFDLKAMEAVLGLSSITFTFITGSTVGSVKIYVKGGKDLIAGALTPLLPHIDWSWHSRRPAVPDLPELKARG